MSITTSIPSTEFKPPIGRLNKRLWLLFVAFIASGIFEVIDNILGIRHLNFDSSAPAAFKVAKEIAIIWFLIGIMTRRGIQKLTLFGIVTFLIIALCTQPIILDLPTTSYGWAGLIYYLASLGMVLITCTLISPSDRKDFIKHFILPVIVAILVTQCLEIVLAPASFYHETNLLGLDRRAGIAVNPTTAGLLGVVGFSTLKGISRLISLVVIGLASSTISLICLTIILISRMRNSIYTLIIFPVVVAISAAAIISREGLESTIMTRLDILSYSMQEFAIFGPSKIGALSTAKSVALNPIESYIIDSMYLQTLHIFGIIPGIVLLTTLLITIHRRAGPLATIILTVSGIGFLVFETWVVWLSILFAFQRLDRHDPTIVNDRLDEAEWSRPIPAEPVQVNRLPS